MSWITRDLALDLLAIAIDGLNKIFDRIKIDTPTTEPSPWAEGQDSSHTPAPQPAPQAAAPTPQPEPQPTEHDPQLHAQAQNILRAINLKEGNTWIIDTLFPRYNAHRLDDVPANKLADLIETATNHKESLTK